MKDHLAQITKNIGVCTKVSDNMISKSKKSFMPVEEEKKQKEAT